MRRKHFVPSIRLRDHLIGTTLAFSYLCVLLFTSQDLAMSRDEGFYVSAAEQYAGWFRTLFENPAAALQQSSIDSAWNMNHEHPALMKSLFALSWMAHQKWDLFPIPSMAFRFPGMLTASLLLWLIYIFGVRLANRRIGLFAASAFALLPRVFYHAHLNCFDVPITLMNTLVVYSYWRSLKKKRWAFATGIAFGLALATKHNSWLLPGIFAIHWAWTWMVTRKRPSIAWLPCMLVLGPLLFIGSWPWLWHNTLPRLEEYARFHLHHEYYNMAYFGHNYFRPPFPISYPFVMTLFTVPLTILVLGFLGLSLRARNQYANLRNDRQQTTVLFLGALLAPLVVIALPSTPIFGGTKHWFPAYPFLCLFAGYGFEWIQSRIPQNATWLAGALFLAPSWIETAHSHPFGLSHYTVAAGGVPGAADYGMNRQFWGFTTGSLSTWFRRHMPSGGSVWICDTVWQAWDMMQRDGALPRNITATGDMNQADFVIVHHEHHFAEVEFQAWVAFQSAKPVHVLTYDGVPIITVYENPHRAQNSF